MGYGNELILDLHGCDVETFTRESIKDYLRKLCDLLGATREKLEWWDYEGYPEEDADAPPHMRGRSVVQFISKSTVVMHTLEHNATLYVNVFSCGEVDGVLVEDLTAAHFGGHVDASTQVERGVEWSA